MATSTVTLPKSAKQPARVRHGARVYSVEPGASIEVPERVGRAFGRIKGVTVKAAGQDTAGAEAGTSS